MATTIPVATPDNGHYDIVIQSGILQNYTTDARVAIVSNTTVAPLHAQSLADRLGAPCITIQDGEQYKNLETIRDLYTQFVKHRLDRKSVIVAVGGGVVGDAVGFAAASYMRGLPFIQVPTTLLSMVDSSVGGKVGVDLPEGKNLVGAFKQPETVLIDPDVLQTLPENEWRNGMAEILKHGLLADESLLNPELHTIAHSKALVTKAVQVKVDVVQRDPFEHGERAHLNLGHTFAHAIEQVTQYAVPHGEAVGIGLVAAARLSFALGMCDENLVERVVSIVSGVGLPTRLPELSPEALYEAMKTDKKWQNGRSRFILLKAIGKPQIVKDVPKDAIIQVLNDMR